MCLLSTFYPSFWIFFFFFFAGNYKSVLLILRWKPFWKAILFPNSLITSNIYIPHVKYIYLMYMFWKALYSLMTVYFLSSCSLNDSCSASHSSLLLSFFFFSLNYWAILFHCNFLQWNKSCWFWYTVGLHLNFYNIVILEYFFFGALFSSHLYAKHGSLFFSYRMSSIFCWTFLWTWCYYLNTPFFLHVFIPWGKKSTYLCIYPGIWIPLSPFLTPKQKHSRLLVNILTGILCMFLGMQFHFLKYFSSFTSYLLREQKMCRVFNG